MHDHRPVRFGLLVGLAGITLAALALAACGRAAPDVSSVSGKATPDTRAAALASPIPATAAPSESTAASQPTEETAPTVASQPTLVAAPADIVVSPPATPTASAAPASQPAAVATGVTTTSNESVTVSIVSSSQATGQVVATSGSVAGLPSARPPAAPPTVAVPTATPQPAAQPSGSQARFLLCGGSNPATSQAIERFIAGRGFSAQLNSRPDGCANLTITLTGGQTGGGVSGSQNTHLAVSNGNREVAVDIVTENGVTRVSVG